MSLNNNHTKGSRKGLREDETDLREVTEWAAGFVVGLFEGGAMSGAPEAPLALWKAGALLEEMQDSTMRLGLVLQLDAVLAVPGAAERAVRNVRRHLVEADPALTLMGDEPPRV